MKITFTIIFLLITTTFYSQDCGPITTGHTFIHDNLQFNILKGEEAFNELNYKTGTGPEGDIDSRVYAPIIYSSNIWAGGMHPNGQIKLAVGDYNEQDWVAGPIGFEGETDAENCAMWDKVFTVTKEEILLGRKIAKESHHCDGMPESLLNWPARGNPFLSEPIDFRAADFWDEDGDGLYNPCAGDVPALAIRGLLPINFAEYKAMIPSQMSFYIINDNGKPNVAPGSVAAQIMTRVYVFSYKTQGAKDIIFVNYKSTNFGLVNLQNFHFGNWFDFDLGCKENDFLGTDSERDMLYVYNSSEEEDCVSDMSALPSSQFGVSYLGGMYTPFIRDTIDGVDTLILPQIGSTDLDTLIRSKMATSIIPLDCKNESNPNACDPQSAEEYYNVLKGLNKDGSVKLDNNGVETKMMLTGKPSDPNGWSLCTENLIPQTTAVISSESKLLQFAASNEVLLAMYHASDLGGDGCPNMEALLFKEQQVQKLYNSRFFHYTGPLSPWIEMSQSDDAITLSILGYPEQYIETVPEAMGFADDAYKFEGIKIYQVASANFDMMELDNPEVSRLVYQGDLENDIEDINNYETVFYNGSKTHETVNKVIAGNSGIAEEVIFDYDLLLDEPVSTGKSYYFVAISYAHNNYQAFDINTETGQKFPYLEGTCGIKVLDSKVLLSNSEIEEPRPYEFYSFGNNWSLENIEQSLKANLYSASGAKIRSWNLNAGSYLSSDGVNIPSGVYFLHVTSHQSKKPYTHKIVSLE